MNISEAQKILDDELLHFRNKSYEELHDFMGSPCVLERKGGEGVLYTIEIEVFWDNLKQAGGDLRVIGSIDDGKFLSALKPLSTDFIMDPKGKFVGE